MGVEDLQLLEVRNTHWCLPGNNSKTKKPGRKAYPLTGEYSEVKQVYISEKHNLWRVLSARARTLIGWGGLGGALADESLRRTGSCGPRSIMH